MKKRTAVVLLFITAFTIGACAKHQSQPLEPVSSTSILQVGDYAEKAKYVHPNGLIEVSILLEPDAESVPSSYLGYALFHEGAVVPKHQHPSSDEYLYFLSGQGEGVVGGKKVKIKAGQAIFIPMGVEHQFKNTGKETVKAVQVYTPSGPEQRFKKWNKQ